MSSLRPSAPGHLLVPHPRHLLHRLTLTTQTQEPSAMVSPPVKLLSTHRVEVQQDMGPVSLKVTHVSVRQGGQLQGRGWSKVRNPGHCKTGFNTWHCYKEGAGLSRI